MRVVQHQDDGRAADRQMGDDPVQTVAHALRVGRGEALGSRGQPQRRGDDAVPGAEDVAAFILGHGGERGLDELAHHMERDLPLLLAATGEQHGAVAFRGMPSGLGEQGGLADAGRSREGQNAAAAGGLAAVRGAAQIVHRPVDRQNLGFPFE
ncbi:hypothetical protein GCM10010336_24270 [Streptomyces goshikiensis]|nr:hypothetical protein GCM10010336_24270 [Streptomyces goshikiensis]